MRTTGNPVASRAAPFPPPAGGVPATRLRRGVPRRWGGSASPGFRPGRAGVGGRGPEARPQGRPTPTTPPPAPPRHVASLAGGGERRCRVRIAPRTEMRLLVTGPEADAQRTAAALAP